MLICHLLYVQVHDCKLLNQNIKGRVDIVVVRTNFNNSKPCSNCIGLMNKCKENGLNIHNIYYSNDVSTSFYTKKCLRWNLS